MGLNFFLSLLDKLPLIKDNLRSLIILSLMGLFVGFTGYPLWVAYRNEEELITFLLNFGNRQVTHSYSREQVEAIRSTLQSLVNDGANRAIFGVYQGNHRVILFEHHRPYDPPLPLGFQTIYLPSTEYKPLYDSLRLDACFALEKTNQANYFDLEKTITGSHFYLSCPSPGNWFLALYVDSQEPALEYQLQEAIDSLSEILL